MVRGSSDDRLLHFSRKTWSILNNLTRRLRRSPLHCTVSANAIVSQLIRNGRYKGIDRESSQLISQEVSDLWRATPTGPGNISESFTCQEFAAALKHLKPGKAPGPDSIYPELHPIPRCVAFFLPACATSKIQKSGEEQW